MAYVIEFFIFAFLGWVVDSLYIFIEKRKVVSSGYFKGVPLCPIYGFGGILLLNTFALMSHIHFAITILIATLLINSLELVGGLFAEHFLNERLWDYSDERLHVKGYISAKHCLLWLGGVSILYMLIGQRARAILTFFNSILVINPYLEVVLLFIILQIAIWVTLRTKKKRLSSLIKSNKTV